MADAEKVLARTGYKSDLYHAQRRQQILAAHPEIRSLMMVDPSFKYVAIVCSLTQIAVSVWLKDQPLTLVLLMGCCVGTLFVCAITNSLHEIVHEQAVEGNPFANKVVGCLANLSMTWPAVGGYYRSHRNHHAYLGSDLDIKYPSSEEARHYDNSLMDRLKFIFLHPVLGGERWQKVAPNDPPNHYATWNMRTVILTDLLILVFCGYKSLLYLFLSFWINDTIFIQGSKNFIDHWVSDDATYTKSYYGPINMINFNIGYHREHHDFPNIPGRYLPMVTKLAPEFYNNPTYIANSIFEEVFRILTAKPGQGLMKHANKLAVGAVAQK